MHRERPQPGGIPTERDRPADRRSGLRRSLLPRYAAQAAENVLTLYPTLIEGLARAESIYQDGLFRFDRAFELNAKRVELGDGELEFIEKHLTTARFGGCAIRGATRVCRS